MATFLMFGKYSAEAIKAMSPARTQSTVDLLKQMGGAVTAMYAVLGEVDLVFVVTLPGIEAAIKASVVLSKQTGIAFTTCPAVTVEEFDKLVA
ncbi:MAG: GYD domain-containing protein [Deltaproteobacteria bacterium]|nr:GYD domain-containing protein [Deltaproteobacteria bacterium]